MPLLGDVFLDTVYQEDLDREVEITDHPIEDGAYISDHIQRKPLIFNISGVVNGSEALRKLSAYQRQGSRLKYSYRNQTSNLVIESFSSGHGVEVKGGFTYSMVMKQISVAKKVAVISLAKPVTNAGTKQPASKSPEPTPKKVVTVKSGDSLSKIAAAHGTNWQALYAKNKSVVGKNPDLIYPGQKIVI